MTSFLTDEEIAAALAGVLKHDASVLLALRQGQGGVWVRLPGNASWAAAGIGDVALSTLDALKEAGTKDSRVYEPQERLTDLDPEAAWKLATPAKGQALKKHITDSLVACGLRGKTGREGEVSEKTRWQVLHRSAFCCEFDGCGEDLWSHFGGTVRGNFSYFAHIVAASPNGPRSDPARAKALANDPRNILLLCDKCHRLIDRIDPDTFDEAYLVAMLERSEHRIRLRRQSLSYPETRVISAIGSIAGQAQPALATTEAAEALWSRGLQPDCRPISPIAYVPKNLSNPHEGPYWAAVFKDLQRSILQLQAEVDGTGLDAHAPEHLAVFPLASTSLQILTGRLIGDRRNVHVFQPDRDAKGNRWLWPQTGVTNSFMLSRHPGSAPSKEAALVMSLTFPVDPARTPHPRLPAVHVTAARHGPACLGSQEDFAGLWQAVGEALRVLTDEMNAEAIHLFVGAPSSACVALGQKLQARHHPSVVCYETDPKTRDFVETIRITREQVRHEASGSAVSITS